MAATATPVAKTAMTIKKTVRATAKMAEMEELARQKLQPGSVDVRASTSEMAGEGECPPQRQI